MIFNSHKILILIDRKNRCAMKKRPRKPTNGDDDIDAGGMCSVLAIYAVYEYACIKAMGIMVDASGTRYNCIWFLNLKT